MTESSTTILRRLLDERGVEWHISNEKGATFWTGQFGIGYYARQNDDGETLHMLGVDLTPKQAIAATLGATDAKPTQVESSGTCHDVWDVELTGRLRFQCSECGAVSLEITPNFCPVCGRKVVDPTTNDVDVEVEQ